MGPFHRGKLLMARLNDLWVHSGLEGSRTGGGPHHCWDLPIHPALPLPLLSRMGHGAWKSVTHPVSVRQQTRTRSQASVSLYLREDCAALPWALAPGAACLYSTVKQSQELGHSQVLNLQRDRRPETRFQPYPVTNQTLVFLPG